MIGLPVISRLNDHSVVIDGPLTTYEGLRLVGDTIRAVSHWSPTSVALVDVVIASMQPMCVVWGDDQTWIYNDVFVPTLGSKHPASWEAHPGRLA